MGIEAEITNDLRELLTERGVAARWSDIDIVVLASRAKHEQQIDIGGFVDSPDMSVRVLKASFPDALPKCGERITVDGVDYRISQVSQHPRSPLLTLSLSGTDE